METKYGFTLISISEFESWIARQNVARTILFVQEHHTYIPSYEHFDGNNHFEKQRGMQFSHMSNNGWRDIGQHFTIFPDGKIMTGRTMEWSPACIYGNNSHSICIENFGYFDTGEDKMTKEQKDSIVRATAALCKRFDIPVDTNGIVYHHWFDLNTGARTNGSGITKTCPGTAFFGGNTIGKCEVNFLPLVKKATGKPAAPVLPIKYGSVTASQLRIRSGAGTRYRILGNTTLGSVIRVYAEKNRWYKISKSKNEWVYGGYVEDVERGTVIANALNVRTGPSTNFHRLETIKKGKEVFIYERVGDWLKISLEDRWVSKKYINVLDSQ